MTTCPRCGLRLESTAIVAAFMDTPQWSFWGVEGCRWIVCRGAGYVHFRVQIDGRIITAWHKSRRRRKCRRRRRGPPNRNYRRCHCLSNDRRTGYHDHFPHPTP